MTDPTPDVDGDLDSWVMANLPGTSFICDNDEFYTMRYIRMGGDPILGYKPEQFLESKEYYAASVAHPDDQDVVDQQSELVTRRPGNAIARYRMISKEGTAVPVLNITRALRSSSGEPTHVIGFVVDISKFRSLQGPSRLLTDENQPGIEGQAPVAGLPSPISDAWVAQQMPVVIYATADDPNYTGLYFNERLRHELGYTRKSFVGEQGYVTSSLVAPEDQDIADLAVELAANEGGHRAARLRLLREDNSEAQAVCITRGVHDERFRGGRGVVGVGIYVHDAQSLQGRAGILT
jgi:PAS domain S-box-containing protein